jgi:ornithine decarboxylase
MAENEVTNNGNDKNGTNGNGKNGADKNGTNGNSKNGTEKNGTNGNGKNGVESNGVDKELLQKLAQEYGTPLFIVDHDKLRQNYLEFKEQLPNVQAYFAIKANSDDEIIKTMYDAGASFDVASFPEFMQVYANIEKMPDKERQDYIWDKIIYANTIKPVEMLEALDKYGPLVTYDNLEEIKKIKQHAPHAGLILRIRVPNTGSMVELSSKFGAHPGEAVDLIIEAFNAGLIVEGISFHVGSQCTNFENYVQALQISADLIKEVETRTGKQLKILDIGGGFPVRYDKKVKPFTTLAKKLKTEIKRLFPPDMQIMAEPGRFMVATACTLVAKVVGKAVRDGKTCYYINDGVYHTFSGQVFDHCNYQIKAFKEGEPQLCAVFGPTCDAFDTITQATELPELEIHDLVYTENI